MTFDSDSYFEEREQARFHYKFIELLQLNHSYTNFGLTHALF